MQSIKKYFGLPTLRLRLPGWSELRDGSFFSRALEDNQSDAAHTSMLRSLEGKLMRMQEVAMWTRPGLSVVTVVITQTSLFYLSSVSLVTSLASALLCLYLYLTCVTRVWPAIRVAPAPDTDIETFTSVHPDLMSAPEMKAVLVNFNHRLEEFSAGLFLLRREQPGKFCLVLSSVFMMLAILGTKVSLGLLLHSALLGLLVIPGLVTRARRSAQLSPIMETLTESLSSCGEMLVYRGKDAPVKDTTGKLLEEFVPETSEETATVLSKALSWKEKPEKEAEYSLTENISIPSHDEVENDSLTNLLEFEQGLQPLPPSVVNQSLGNISDSDSGEDSRAEGKLKSFNDSDTEDSLDLEKELRRSLTEPEPPQVAPVTSVRAPDFEEELRRSLTVGLAESVTSSVTYMVSSQVGAMMGAVTTGGIGHQRRASDLEDFEIIDEDLLVEESI